MKFIEVLVDLDKNGAEVFELVNLDNVSKVMRGGHFDGTQSVIMFNYGGITRTRHDYAGLVGLVMKAQKGEL